MSSRMYVSLVDDLDQYPEVIGSGTSALGLYYFYQTRLMSSESEVITTLM